MSFKACLDILFTEDVDGDLERLIVCCFSGKKKADTDFVGVISNDGKVSFLSKYAVNEKGTSCSSSV